MDRQSSRVEGLVRPCASGTPRRSTLKKSQTTGTTTGELLLSRNHETLFLFESLGEIGNHADKNGRSGIARNGGGWLGRWGQKKKEHLGFLGKEGGKKGAVMVSSIC